MPDDLEDTQLTKPYQTGHSVPLNTILSPHQSSELEETKPRKAIRVSDSQVSVFPAQEVQPVTPSQQKFSWTAFFVMLIAISAALLVGVLIPGPFDEAIMIIIIAAINGFMSAHGFSIKNFFGRK